MCPKSLQTRPKDSLRPHELQLTRLLSIGRQTETNLQVEGKTFRAIERTTYPEEDAQINLHPHGLWG